MSKLDRPLVLVGCGKMGGAMLDGWLSSGIVAAGVYAVDPMGAPEFADRPGVTAVKDASELPADLDPQVVVMAVKPQMMDALVGDYARFAGGDTFFLSIAAGKTIAYFKSKLGEEAAVVRSMPNTPAAIGQGITVACPCSRTNADQLALSKDLLSAVGEAVSVDDEDLLDAVTALSGGGPAYTFLLVETMSAAGVKAGLSEDMAARLALVTVAGAGQLALASDEAPSKLRENVTSPNGTTLEALKVLMRDSDGLPDLMAEAIAAATRRSKELGG